MNWFDTYRSVWFFWFVVALTSLTNTVVSVGLLFYGDAWLIIELQSVFGFRDWLGFILLSAPILLASLFVLYVSVHNARNGCGGGDDQ